MKLNEYLEVLTRGTDVTVWDDVDNSLCKNFVSYNKNEACKIENNQYLLGSILDVIAICPDGAVICPLRGLVIEKAYPRFYEKVRELSNGDIDDDSIKIIVNECIYDICDDELVDECLEHIGDATDIIDDWLSQNTVEEFLQEAIDMDSD